MHKAIRRAAVTTCVALTMMMPAHAGATGVTSNDCSAATSTQLYNGGTGNITTDRIWVDQPTTTRTVVCIQLWSEKLGGLTIVADTSSGTAPNADVNLQGDPATCPDRIGGTGNPVPTEIRTDVGNATVCVTVGPATIVVRFVPGTIGPSNVPSLEIWHDGANSAGEVGWFDVLACPDQYALVVAHASNDRTCMTRNSRLV